MGILIIIILLILTVIGLWLLFKVLKWVYQKKTRVVGLLFLLVTVGITTTIYQMYFVKMEFIQSKVYPDLYLIKNIEDRNLVYKAIKEKVLQEVKNTSKEPKLQALRFYEYNKGDWGENGTAYFIEHKERRDGMTAELLEYYPEYLLAEFSLQPCKESSSGYFGKLIYFNDNRRIKTDTLLNSCKKEI